MLHQKILFCVWEERGLILIALSSREPFLPFLVLQGKKGLRKLCLQVSLFRKRYKENEQVFLDKKNPFFTLLKRKATTLILFFTQKKRCWQKDQGRNNKELRIKSLLKSCSCQYPSKSATQSYIYFTKSVGDFKIMVRYKRRISYWVWLGNKVKVVAIEGRG